MKRETVSKATEIVFRLREAEYIDGENREMFVDWFFRAMALACAYAGERFNSCDTPNIRMLHVFECYKKDDPLKWTVAAYLLYNDIGDEYALSIYEHECKDDWFYIELGKIFESVLT